VLARTAQAVAQSGEQPEGDRWQPAPEQPVPSSQQQIPEAPSLSIPAPMSLAQEPYEESL